MLKVPEREGILRAIDGQHRLLALHADIDRFGDEDFTVPAIIFDRLPEDHVVQMFVTINAKHTRLNASHLVSLSGRQLYRDETWRRRTTSCARSTTARTRRSTTRSSCSASARGRVAQAPLAQELKKLFAADGVRRGRDRATFHEEAKKFFVNYFKQIALVFGGAWNGRKYSIKSRAGAARVHPRRAGRRPPARSGARRSRRLPRHRPRDCAVGPPHRRPAVRDRRRVEAQRQLGRGLARELRLALQYPEGATV